MTCAQQSLASFEGVEGPPPVSRWQLVKQLGGYPWAVCVTFWVTIAAYPALTASICSVRNPATSFPCAADTPSGRLYGADLQLPFSSPCRQAVQMADIANS